MSYTRSFLSLFILFATLTLTTLSQANSIRTPRSSSPPQPASSASAPAGSPSPASSSSTPSGRRIRF